MRWPVPGALALLLLAGCRAPHTGPVRLERGAPFTLCPPGAGPAFFATQEVVFTPAQGEPETFLTTVESTPERLSLVASTPFGQTLFTVQVGRDGVQVDRRVPLPAWLDLRLLPALVQLAHWPVAALQAGLGRGLTLEEAGPLRTLRKGSRVLLELRREGPGLPCRQVDLRLPERGVQVRITTLEEGTEGP